GPGAATRDEPSLGEPLFLRAPEGTPASVLPNRAVLREAPQSSVRLLTTCVAAISANAGSPHGCQLLQQSDIGATTGIRSGEKYQTRGIARSCSARHGSPQSRIELADPEPPSSSTTSPTPHPPKTESVKDVQRQCVKDVMRLNSFTRAIIATAKDGFSR